METIKQYIKELEEEHIWFRKFEDTFCLDYCDEPEPDEKDSEILIDFFCEISSLLATYRNILYNCLNLKGGIDEWQYKQFVTKNFKNSKYQHIIDDKIKRLDEYVYFALDYHVNNQIININKRGTLFIFPGGRFH